MSKGEDRFSHSLIYYSDRLGIKGEQVVFELDRPRENDQAKMYPVRPWLKELSA
ncbi:MAG: hypothetical protein HQK52_07050 [Oligoflexia bacterium]|nr:hypothetical protein [Oligoflexia bacterium]